MFDNLMFSLYASVVVGLYIYFFCPICWGMIWDEVIDNPVEVLSSFAVQLALSLAVAWVTWEPLYFAIVVLAATGAIISMSQEETLVRKELDDKRRIVWDDAIKSLSKTFDEEMSKIMKR
jgi:hypothetical protein